APAPHQPGRDRRRPRSAPPRSAAHRPHRSDHPGRVMTTTDQRPAHPDTRTAAPAPDDPRAVRPLIRPVGRRAAAFLRALRPAAPLSRVITPEVAQQLARRAALTRRLRATTGYAPPRQLMVPGVRQCVVNDHTVEASCVLREPDRARFLAMRWELRHTGWRVTVLEIG